MISVVLWDKQEITDMIKQGRLMVFEQRKRNWESLTLLNTIFRNLFIKAHDGTIPDAWDAVVYLNK